MAKNADTSTLLTAEDVRVVWSLVLTERSGQESKEPLSVTFARMAMRYGEVQIALVSKDGLSAGKYTPPKGSGTIDHWTIRLDPKGS